MHISKNAKITITISIDVKCVNWNCTGACAFVIFAFLIFAFLLMRIFQLRIFKIRVFFFRKIVTHPLFVVHQGRCGSPGGNTPRNARIDCIEDIWLAVEVPLHDSTHGRLCCLECLGIPAICDHRCHTLGTWAGVGYGCGLQLASWVDGLDLGVLMSWLADRGRSVLFALQIWWLCVPNNCSGKHLGLAFFPSLVSWV